MCVFRSVTRPMRSEVRYIPYYTGYSAMGWQGYVTAYANQGKARRAKGTVRKHHENKRNVEEMKTKQRIK